MLRLKIERAARHVDLGHGVGLVMRQPGQLDFDMAANAGRAAARRLADTASGFADYALDHLATDRQDMADFLASDPDGLIGYGHHLLAVHLGMLVIDKVTGVAGLDGKPMGTPVLRDLSALFLTIVPGMSGASFGTIFLAIAENGAALEISEGNASAVAPAGHSGAAANTAPDAPATPAPAPVAATPQGAPSAQPSARHR